MAHHRRLLVGDGRTTEDSLAETTCACQVSSSRATPALPGVLALPRQQKQLAAEPEQQRLLDALPLRLRGGRRVEPEVAPPRERVGPQAEITACLPESPQRRT